MERRQRFRIYAAGLLGLFMLATLGLAEYAARQMPIRFHYLQFDPREGKVPEAGASYDYVGPGYRNRISFNSRHFRGPQPALSDDSVRIAFLGDSYTLAAEVPYEASWPVITAGLLAGELGRPVESLNFGVVSYSIANVLTSYVYRARELQPRVAVYTVCGNDWEDADTARVLAPGDGENVELLPVPRPGWWQRFNSAAEKQVRLYKLVRSLPRILAFNFGGRGRMPRTSAGTPAERMRVFIDALSENRSPEDPETVRRIRRFNAITAEWVRRVRSDGAVPYVVFTNTLRDWQRRSLAETLGSLEVRYLDLHDEALSDPSGWESWHFDVDAHWSPHGNRRVAELVAERLSPVMDAPVRDKPSVATP